MEWLTAKIEIVKITVSTHCSWGIAQKDRRQVE